MHGAAFTWLLSAGVSVEIFPYGWTIRYRNLARISGLHFAQQNTNKEYHDESKYPGWSGYTRLNIGLRMHHFRQLSSCPPITGVVLSALKRVDDFISPRAG